MAIAGRMALLNNTYLVNGIPSPELISRPLTISVKDLSKRFNREWIFRHLTFDFLPGETYAITGPNGSGKSTFLQVAWGQVPQTSGSITWKKGTATIEIEEVFQHLSIATPYMDLIDEFTLEEMLHFHFSLKKIRADFSIADLLRIMYLEQAAEKQLVNFSSGMKQRLKLGLALYTQADVYFFDEPGTNLDTKAFGWYTEELSSLPQGAMVFIASNNAAEYPKTSQILNIQDYKQ
jgi:ABC-type multidrug transport system ATPase subunit